MKKLGRNEFIGIMLRVINNNYHDVFCDFGDWADLTDFILHDETYDEYKEKGKMRLEETENNSVYNLSIEIDNKNSIVNWKLEPEEITSHAGAIAFL
ncbi:MAG: hypothetical protein ACRDCW_06665 [Sarcina sp.]